jgi:hypothetical protein
VAYDHVQQESLTNGSIAYGGIQPEKWKDFGKCFTKCITPASGRVFLKMVSDRPQEFSMNVQQRLNIGK